MAYVSRMSAGPCACFFFKLILLLLKRGLFALLLAATAAGVGPRNRSAFLIVRAVTLS